MEIFFFIDIWLIAVLILAVIGGIYWLWSSLFAITSNILLFIIIIGGIILSLIFLSTIFTHKKVTDKIIGVIMAIISFPVSWMIYEEIIVLGIKDPDKGIPIYYGILATFLYVSAIVLVGICCSLIDAQKLWMQLAGIVVTLFVLCGVYYIPYKIAYKSYYNKTVEYYKDAKICKLKDDAGVYIYTYGQIKSSKGKRYGAVEAMWFPLGDVIGNDFYVGALEVKKLDKGTEIYLTGDDSTMLYDKNSEYGHIVNYLEFYDKNGNVGYIRENLVE